MLKTLAGATEVASACNVKHLDRQTTLSARIERKGLFRRVLNNFSPDAHEIPCARGRGICLGRQHLDEHGRLPPKARTGRPAANRGCIGGRIVRGDARVG